MRQTLRSGLPSIICSSQSTDFSGSLRPDTASSGAKQQMLSKRRDILDRSCRCPDLCDTAETLGHSAPELQTTRPPGFETLFHMFTCVTQSPTIISGCTTTLCEHILLHVHDCALVGFHLGSVLRIESENLLLVHLTSKSIESSELRGICGRGWQLILLWETCK